MALASDAPPQQHGVALLRCRPRRHRTGRASVDVSTIDVIDERGSWLGATLVLPTVGGEWYTAGGFREAGARRFVAAVMEASARATAAAAPELVRTADATAGEDYTLHGDHVWSPPRLCRDGGRSGRVLGRHRVRGTALL